MERGGAEEEGSHTLWAKRAALVSGLVGDHAAARWGEGVRIIIVTTLQVGVGRQARVAVRGAEEVQCRLGVQEEATPQMQREVGRQEGQAGDEV